MAVNIGVNIQRSANRIAQAVRESGVGGKYPELLLDFDDGYYRANGGSKPLSEVVNHSRAGNATMVASDGLIKWAPHNLLTYSEAFNDVSWATFNATKASTTEIDPAGGNTALYLTDMTTTNSRLFKSVAFDGADSTFAVWMKGVAGTTISIELDTSTNSVTLTADWQLYTVTKINASGSQLVRVIKRLGDTAEEVYVAFPHVYRSDLGGMVDVPAGERVIPSASTYVPTTSSARYLPRVGHHVYNGSAWVNEGLLHESEARTNLNIYSQEISSWNLANAAGRLAVIDNQSSGPDGETSLSRIQLNDNTSGGKLVSQTITYTSGAQATVSCYFKPDEYTTFAIGIGDGENNWARVVFDTSTVSSTQQPVGATSGTVHDYGITALSGNLYYAWATVSVTEDGDNSAGLAFLITNSATPTFNTYGANVYAGTAGEGAYAGFIQAEAAPTPSSYIPTAGSTVTRAAETLTIPSANLPYSSTAMSIQMDGRATWVDEDAVAQVGFVRWRFDPNNKIFAYIKSDGANIGKVFFEQEQSNINDSVLSGEEYTPGILVPYNIASRHGSTFINGAVDGVALTADTTPTALPDLSSTDLDLGYNYMGTVERFRVWGVDLGDTGIETATAPSLEPSLSLTFDSSESSFVVDDWSA